MRFCLIIFIFLLLPIGATPPVTLLKEIGVELSKLENGLVKKLLEERVEKAWAISDEAEKEKALGALLAELKKVSLKVAVEPINIEKEVELCNYLVQQACILEALDGAGVKVIKQDLTGNLNDHGLSREGKRLLRRLVQLCDEAEKSYQDVTYVEDDGSEAKAELLTENIGTGLGVSLVMGDITPLISAAVKIGSGYSAINKSESRQLEILVRAHQGRIVNFLFNVNSYKNDLIAEQGVAENHMISPDWYRQFLKFLGEAEDKERLRKIKGLVEKYPNFATSNLYLAQLYYNSGEILKSQQLLSSIIDQKSLLLDRDGLQAQAYFIHAQINVEKKDFKSALANLDLSIKENPFNPFVFDLRAKLAMDLKQYESAYNDSKKAHKLQPDSVEFLYSYFKASVLYSKNSQLDKLQQLLDLGFADLEAIKSWEPYKPYIGEWVAKALLTPQLKLLYKPGLLFKDDILIENIGSSSLDNIDFDLEIKYLKKGVWEVVNVTGNIPALARGEVFKVKNRFGMPRKSQCSTSIKFRSEQNREKIELEAFYNYFGNRGNLQAWEYYRQKAYEVYLNENEKSLIINGLIDAEKAVHQTFYRDPQSLYVLAHLYFKLGEKTKAVLFLNKGLKALEKKHKGNDFDVMAKPYRDALDKFK